MEVIWKLYGNIVVVKANIQSVTGNPSLKTELSLPVEVGPHLRALPQQKNPKCRSPQLTSVNAVLQV